MVSKQLTAAYATDVFHHGYVVKAMNEIFASTVLFRRAEVPQRLIDQLERLPSVSRLTSVLSRRVHRAIAEPDRTVSLGPMQFVHPLFGRLGWDVSTNLRREITESYARRVAGNTAGVDVLHFVEGLGHVALSKNPYVLTICEKRSPHHEVFEKNMEVFADFPFEQKRIWNRDILTNEYDRSDYIHVYSETAKLSFIERGYPKEKIIVVPIGLGNQLPRLDRKRHQFTLTYVGRGDAFKGLDVAVAAVELLGHPYRLDVAGPMSAAVADWLKSKPFVDYHGVLNRLDLVELYSRSGGLLMPSIESFGLVVAEAAHHGAHVYCMKETGMGEYLGHKAKTIIERDPAQLASALLANQSRSYSQDDPDEPSELSSWDALDDDFACSALREAYMKILPRS